MKGVVMEAHWVGKRFGNVRALSNVSFQAGAGEIHCLLGDNGAGKSTLIKILSGTHRPSEGTLQFLGNPVTLNSPRDAQKLGIATVYQDLALIPLMSITRNFFLGHEPVRGVFPLRWFDRKHARSVVVQELKRLGITVRDPDQPAGTLSGGERQSLAIARAVFLGARLLILDEPTAALGVAQTEMVLETIRTLRGEGLAVVLITHNVNHAYAVGDRFTVLSQGQTMGTWTRDTITIEALQDRMAGKEVVSADPEKGD